MAEQKEVDGEATNGSSASSQISFSFQKANSLLLDFSILNVFVDITHCNTSAQKMLHEQLSRLTY